MRNFKIRVQLHDLLFFLLLFFSFYFTRNMLCRLMMVLFFGYTMVRQIINNRKILFSFFYIGFSLFILYGVGNIFLNNVINAQVARTMVISLTLNLLMIYSIVQYIYMQNDIPKIIKITELGIISTAFAVVILSLETITSGRLGKGTEINANMLAILCVYGFVLSMYLRKIDKISQTAYYLRLIFYTMAVLLTGSRKGLIMIFLSVMIISFIYGKRKLFRIILIGLSAAILVYLIIMKVDFLYNIIGIRIENLLLFLTEGTVEEGSLESRLTLIEIAKPYIAEKPWTGYGYDCFKTISGTGGSGKVSGDSFGFYSHNNYIELLFGGGIIGLVLYYIPMIYLLRNLVVKLKSEPYVLYLFAIFVSNLALEYARVTYYERIDAYIIAIILGCTLMCGKKRTGATSK